MKRQNQDTPKAPRQARRSKEIPLRKVSPVRSRAGAGAKPEDPFGLPVETLPLSWLARPDYATFSRLRRRAQEQADLYFGIVRSPGDLARLVVLRGRGKQPKEARKKLNDLLDDRARKALARLKRFLSLERGKPRDFSKRKVWRVAAALREEDPSKHSWSKLARRLDPKGYAETPHLAKERMRQGVRAVQREKAQPRGKSA